MKACSIFAEDEAVVTSADPSEGEQDLEEDSAPKQGDTWLVARS